MMRSQSKVKTTVLFCICSCYLYKIHVIIVKSVIKLIFYSDNLILIILWILEKTNRKKDARFYHSLILLDLYLDICVSSYS